jgi:hypothetical protein
MILKQFNHGLTDRQFHRKRTDRRFSKSIASKVLQFYKADFGPGFFAAGFFAAGADFLTTFPGFHKIPLR